MMNEFDKVTRAALQFATALKDCLNEEEDRELFNFDKIDIEEISGNDLILAMYGAVMFVTTSLTDFDGDRLDFLNVLNHLLLQKALGDQQKNLNGLFGYDDESEEDE